MSKYESPHPEESHEFISTMSPERRAELDERVRFAHDYGTDSGVYEDALQARDAEIAASRIDVTALRQEARYDSGAYQYAQELGIEVQL